MVPDRLYTARDMAKIGCNGCQGCSYCCQEMGESVILTPFDICELTKNLGKSFDELMEDKIELYMTDGMVMPNLKMARRTVPTDQKMGKISGTTALVDTTSGGEKEICGFLNEEGRCSIHAFRPGLCRLFPLGRNYEVRQVETEDGIQEVKGFQYFIVKDSCPKMNGTKVRIEKWLEIPNLKKNEEFITRWHYFCKDFQEKMQALLDAGEDEKVKKSNLAMLELFYRKPYGAERDFYEEFEERMGNCERYVCTNRE